MQSAFKILINSAYGYLATGGMNFADFDAAEMVTAIGRNIIARMRDWLTSQGVTVIELDTDGLYFRKPLKMDILDLSRGLAAQLPAGIEVDFDRYYPAMFSYKMKNHALLTGCGRVVIKGAALRSRAREPYLCNYQARVLELILTDRANEVPALHDETVRALRAREIPLEDLIQTQTLNDTLEEYQEKIEAKRRHRSAAYEVAIANGRPAGRGDKIGYYFCPPGDGESKSGPKYKRAKAAPAAITAATAQRDEDVELYVKRLEQVAKPFRNKGIYE